MVSLVLGRVGLCLAGGIRLNYQGVIMCDIENCVQSAQYTLHAHQSRDRHDFATVDHCVAALGANSATRGSLRRLNRGLRRLERRLEADCALHPRALIGLRPSTRWVSDGGSVPWTP